MTSCKRYTWKWQITLLMLTSWICAGEFAAIALAEVQAPRRKRRMMISTKPEQKQGPTKVDIGKSLMKIARIASRQSKNQMIDFVFVIDGKAKMKVQIAAIERRLVDIVSHFEQSAINYQFALIRFKNVNRTPYIKVHPLQSEFSKIQEGFGNLRRELGDATTGYGLDAIMQGLRELKFRTEAVKHIVVVTNGRLQTSWRADNAINQLGQEIIDLCHQDEIHIDVIGINEQVQTQLASETEGKWYPIDTNQKQPNQSLVIDNSILRIEGIFKRIAQHITATVKSAVDIVFVFDSSMSMGTKVDEVCTGIERIVKVLNSEGIDYRFGVVRFWAAAGGGESSVVVTKPPLNVSQVQSLFQLPKRGDEHLLDAIIQSVPRLRTPIDRQLVLVVVTDESTSNRKGKGYTSREAISVCQQAKAQVHVIGGITPVRSGSFGDAFQRRVAEVTKGLHFIMPGSVIADKRR